MSGLQQNPRSQPASKTCKSSCRIIIQLVLDVVKCIFVKFRKRSPVTISCHAKSLLQLLPHALMLAWLAQCLDLRPVPILPFLPPLSPNLSRHFFSGSKNPQQTRMQLLVCTLSCSWNAAVSAHAAFCHSAEGINLSRQQHHSGLSVLQATLVSHGSWSKHLELATPYTRGQAFQSAWAHCMWSVC